MTASVQQTISPVDGSVYVERPLASEAEVEAAALAARQAQQDWRRVDLGERARLLEAFTAAMLAETDAIALELTWQMGRPIRQTPGELRGFAERARYMIGAAGDSLADVQVGQKEGFIRFIRREPLGVVFVVAPWNYPLLTAVNAVVPALLAGNAVLLKHSSQTPLVAERFSQAGAEAGLPAGLLQHLHMGHAAVSRLIASEHVDYVAFTGSVEGGRAVHRAAGDRFIACGLELGGKDPGYVRADADLPHAIETLVDGAFFNAGQSCCGIERIYVHPDVYDGFVEGAVALAREYVLDDPTRPETTLGPVIRRSAADAIRAQVAAAVAAGAKPLIDAAAFPRAQPDSPYLAPQILVDVDHSMDVMREETFGPVVGIMQVASDDEAVRLMNDSRYGLTAAVFTQDLDAALAIGDRIETGTWFMNRCDYLDPALAWTGVRDSGRGCTLSRVGFEHLTRPKSFHLKTAL